MMIGIYIGQFCLTSMTWFFLTWFPTYLMEAKHMSILKVDIVASIPAIAGFAGGMVGGVWSDWFLRHGFSLTVARKTPIIVGLIFSISIILANYVSSDIIVVLVMSIAFFSKGVGKLGWCIVGDVSPKEAMGIAGGMCNLFGNQASIVTAIAIGYFVADHRIVRSGVDLRINSSCAGRMFLPIHCWKARTSRVEVRVSWISCPFVTRFVRDAGPKSNGAR